MRIILKKIILMLTLIFMVNVNYGQQNPVDCFNISGNAFDYQPGGDTLGYLNYPTPILNVPYFGTGSNLGYWDISQSYNPGMSSSSAGAAFFFDGSNQKITYEIYGIYPQFNQMGFSVNGSSAIALNSSFPVTVNGIIVNLDTTATNLPNWENIYLSFAGNVNDIEIYAFESGIRDICVTPLNYCTDFTNPYSWTCTFNSYIDTIGFIGSGPIVKAPYFGTGSTSGYWDVTNNYFPGIYGSIVGASFPFDGSSQAITYEIYGSYNQFNQMGFSVNGSSAIALNSTFPVTVNGIIVNLDTTATNLPNWENVYLSFTGNVNNIEIYAFESGIINMCVNSLIVDTLIITAVSEYNNLNNVTVYPNPATNSLTIDNKNNLSENLTLSLMNIQGQKIVSNEINLTTTHTINVGNLSNGVYILNLHNDKINYISRIVIQNE